MKTQMLQRIFFITTLFMLTGLWTPQLAAAWPGNPNVNVPICTADASPHWPTIVSDGSGGAIITWGDQRSGSYDIYAQRVDADGNVQWTTNNGVPICTASGKQRD